jgi:hypothetical protein
MSRVLMISADCHATASRAGYREYLDRSVIEDFDRWVESVEGTDEGLNAHPRLDESVNWDSDLRLAALEAEGTVAEVIFPNALPFGDSARKTSSGRSSGTTLSRCTASTSRRCRHGQTPAASTPTIC